MFFHFSISIAKSLILRMQTPFILFYFLRDANTIHWIKSCWSLGCETPSFHWIGSHWSLGCKQPWLIDAGGNGHVWKEMEPGDFILHDATIISINKHIWSMDPGFLPCPAATSATKARRQGEPFKPAGVNCTFKQLGTTASLVSRIMKLENRQFK